MPAELDVTTLYTPYCNDEGCMTSGGPRASKADAEEWMNAHDEAEHSGVVPAGYDA